MTTKTKKPSLMTEFMNEKVLYGGEIAFRWQVWEDIKDREATHEAKMWLVCHLKAINEGEKS